MSTVEQKPQPQESSPKAAPAFSSVFSTTGKVVLALFLIALGVGVLVGLVKLVGSGGRSSSSSTDTWEKNRHNERADNKKTSMPLSKWNQTIAAAIRQHCAAEGMSKEDAEKALGKPSAKDDLYWTYERTTQKECVKYDGDKCSEYNTVHETAFVEFSPNGHLKSPEGLDDNWLHRNCFAEPFYSRYYQNW